MIKLKMKRGNVKAKAKGDEMFFAVEMAFGAACCINEIAKTAADFERIKRDVIRRLENITFPDVYPDEEEYIFDSEE